MSDEQAFLDALAANPADDLARLVYADWLDEHAGGRPASAGSNADRARYLRLVAALARMPDGELLESTAHDEILPLVPLLDPDWQRAVGRRFEVVLVGYIPNDRIVLIRAVMDLLKLDFSLAAEELVNAVPAPLGSPLTYDEAVRLYREWLRYEHWFHVRPKVVVRATATPEGVAGSTYDVVLRRLPPNFWRYWGPVYKQPVAELLGLPTRDAADRVRNLPAVLARDVAWEDLGPTLRRVRQAFNQFGAELLPPDAVSVVPHTPGDTR